MALARWGESSKALAKTSTTRRRIQGIPRCRCAGRRGGWYLVIGEAVLTLSWSAWWNTGFNCPVVLKQVRKRRRRHYEKHRMLLGRGPRTRTRVDTDRRRYYSTLLTGLIAGLPPIGNGVADSGKVRIITVPWRIVS